MFRASSVVFILAVAAVVSGRPAAAADCPFGFWQTFKGTKLYRTPNESAYVYTTDHARVDADGAPDAYHPDDVGSCGASGKGRDCPANAGFPDTNWWDSVLVADPSNPSRPFVQPSGPHAGFFISRTWLEDPAKPQTDTARYVDSATVPYIVFPGNEFPQLSGTGFKGDVGFAWHLGNGTSTAFIVADRGGGPDAKLGEGSVALFEALGGQNVNARNGSGIARGQVRFVVFPGSRRAVPSAWPRSNAQIAEQARGLVEDLGGADAVLGCDL